MAEQLRRFHVRATTPERTLYVGEIEAIDASAASQLLRERGYAPLEVSATPIRAGVLETDIRWPGANRLGLAECEQFCRELGQMQQAGVPTERALGLIATAAPQGSRLRRLAERSGHGLRLGLSLSRAIAASGLSLPVEFLPSLDAGERSGEVASVLLTLERSFAQRRKFRGTYLGALSYPAFLVFVAFGVLAMIALVVAPNLIAVFDTLGRTPPPLIAVLATIGAAASGAPLVALAVVASCIAGLSAAITLPVGRRALRRSVFHVPVLGMALRWSGTERLFSTLAMQLRARTALPLAVTTAFAAAGFPNETALARRTVTSLEGGDGLATALARIAVIPSRATQMLKIGEDTGRLDGMLEAIATESRENFQNRMSALSGLLAPILILIVGGMIGTIVFSVFSALAEMNNFAS